jgi:hypothetical protein
VGSVKNVILLELGGRTLAVRKRAASYLVKGLTLETRKGGDLGARWESAPRIPRDDSTLSQRFTRHVSTGVHRRQMGTCVEQGATASIPDACCAHD